ncbi:hypothetical protein AB0O28_01975 [Microbispora sp. NPDC088329]
MGFVLNLQEISRSASGNGEGARTVSTNSWFNCQSTASQVFCITTITA